jgi:hypothetical protein
MNTLLTRVVAASALAVAALAVPASAGSKTIPGCYGASSVIVCDPTVSWGVPVGVETYETTVPVCAGTCQDVPVTLVRRTSGEPLAVCATWTDRNGYPGGTCVDGVLVDEVLTLTADEVDYARQVVCGGDDIQCGSLVYQLFNIIENAIRP